MDIYIQLMVYAAIFIGIFYAALLPYYKKNAEHLLQGLEPVVFAKKYIVTVLINLALNIFVAMLAIQAFLPQIDTMEATGLMGILIVAFIWGVQSQKSVNLVADWLDAATIQESPVSLPKVVRRPPSPPMT